MIPIKLTRHIGGINSIDLPSILNARINLSVLSVMHDFFNLKYEYFKN